MIFTSLRFIFFCWVSVCWVGEEGCRGDCQSFLRRQAPLKCEGKKKKSPLIQAQKVLNITHLVRFIFNIFLKNASNCPPIRLKCKQIMHIFFISSSFHDLSLKNSALYFKNVRNKLPIILRLIMHI